MGVKGKTILITGGAGGLGSAMAKTLAQNGAEVFIMDLPSAAETAETVIESIKAKGGDACFIPADITSDEDWSKAFDMAVQKTGKVDVLINNAGINIRKPIEEMNFEEWMTMMRINTGGVFLGTKHAIPQMREQGGGSIINTSSVCGLVGHKFTPEAYTATKGAVTMFTKAVASRYGEYNIRSNCICPSTVNTPLISERLKEPAFAAERLGEVPLGRLCTEDDVANAVLFLASDESSFINGIALSIDGGVTCY